MISDQHFVINNLILFIYTALIHLVLKEALNTYSGTIVFVIEEMDFFLILFLLVMLIKNIFIACVCFVFIQVCQIKIVFLTFVKISREFSQAANRGNGLLWHIFIRVSGIRVISNTKSLCSFCLFPKRWVVSN